MSVDFSFSVFQVSIDMVWICLFCLYGKDNFTRYCTRFHFQSVEYLKPVNIGLERGVAAVTYTCAILDFMTFEFHRRRCPAFITYYTAQCTCDIMLPQNPLAISRLPH